MGEEARTTDEEARTAREDNPSAPEEGSEAPEALEETNGGIGPLTLLGRLTPVGRLTVLHLLNGALAVGLGGAAALAWFGPPNLLAGSPDSLPNLFTWFAPTALGLGMAGLAYLAGTSLGKRPELLELPGRRFSSTSGSSSSESAGEHGSESSAESSSRRLSPRQRKLLGREVRFLFYASATFVLGVFALLQLAVYRNARGEPPTLILIVLITGGLFLPPLLLALWFRRFLKLIEAGASSG